MQAELPVRAHLEMQAELAVQAQLEVEVLPRVQQVQALAAAAG
jgi:hypothetical protein